MINEFDDRLAINNNEAVVFKNKLDSNKFKVSFLNFCNFFSVCLGI